MINSIDNKVSYTKKVVNIISYIFIILIVHYLFNEFFIKNIYSVVFLYLITNILTILFIIKIEKIKLVFIGLTTKNIKKQLKLGVLLFIAYFCFKLILSLIIRNNGFFYVKNRSMNELIFSFFYYILVVGFTEELIFRGYLFERFKELFNSVSLAILMSSILFGLMHYTKGNGLNAFFTGLVYCLFKIKFSELGLIGLSLIHGLFDYALIIGGFIIFTLL